MSNTPALKVNGVVVDHPTKVAPVNGPIAPLPSSCTHRMVAFDLRYWLGSVRSGTTSTDAASYNSSNMPKNKANAQSSRIDPAPRWSATASPTKMSARARLTRYRVRNLLHRSSMTPIGMERNALGNVAAVATSATSSAESAYAVVSTAKAATRIPSMMFDPRDTAASRTIGPRTKVRALMRLIPCVFKHLVLPVHPYSDRIW